MSAEQTPDIETVLAEHSTVATGLGEWCCKCSPMTWRPTVHRAPHVAQALAPVLAAAVRDAEQRVADAFVEWAMKNEIAEPPLDWAWFGEITRRYWRHHPDALHQQGVVSDPTLDPAPATEVRDDEGGA